MSLVKVFVILFVMLGSNLFCRFNGLVLIEDHYIWVISFLSSLYVVFLICIEDNETFKLGGVGYSSHLLFRFIDSITCSFQVCFF